MQQDFTNLFSRTNLLSSPKLILSLDDNLTLPTAVLHASLSPSTPYAEFLDIVKAVPLFLLSKDGQRLASTAFSHISICVARGTTKTDIDQIISAVVPFKGDAIAEETNDGEVLVKADNKEAFAKAVAAIKEKGKPKQLYFLTDGEAREIKGEIVTEAKNGNEYVKSGLKQYNLIELLKIFSGMDVYKQPPRRPRRLGWYEKEALDVVLRDEPIRALAMYLPVVYEDKEYFSYRGGHYGHYDTRGYGMRKRYNRYNKDYQYR